MVRVTAYVHHPVYNYSHKYRNLDMMTKDVKNFLHDYDQIILHKDPYRGVFHSYLREIRTKVKQLLLKFDAAPYDDGSAKTDKELFCCGLAFHDAGELRRHYKAVHNEPFIRYMNAIELKSALAKLDHMRHRLNEYINFGEEYTLNLLINLKRMLKKISNSLKF
ncbi:AAEL010183-PA [Aedes aegypti]|uniref:AAEL010183-PA n=1 Tax=Aedes aegypti TaxID=7159 RepID=Q16TP1_AEDAE|nr:AAEL010183-PA [Aedes aegypti]